MKENDEKEDSWHDARPRSRYNEIVVPRHKESDGRDLYMSCGVK